MRDLKFMTICPDDTYYTWQVNLWMESLKELGHSDKAIVLIFVPKGRVQNTKWETIISLYPEAEFHFYHDEDDVTKLLGIYIPVLRPYTAWKYFKQFPERHADAIFYCDSDIIFTKDFNIDQLLEDDICYLSNTNSYINVDYFDSKINQVLPEKLEEYKTRDILAEIGSVIGIDRETAVANNLHSGGAQYLLKNLDGYFWSKVMNDSILIRTYLQKINREFFKDENSGFQSWCADMWAVLWNLWVRGQETRVVPELNFAWATDPIEKLETTTIFHNAGIVSETGNGYPAFYKGKYIGGQNPMIDPFFETILNDEVSKTKCTWFYVNKLKQLKEKYNINY